MLYICKPGSHGVQLYTGLSVHIFYLLMYVNLGVAGCNYTQAYLLTYVNLGVAGCNRLKLPYTLPCSDTYTNLGFAGCN